jgi:hypothetical protein
MPRVSFPVYCVLTPAADAIVGRQKEHVTALALRAILQHRRGIEIAHQQIVYRGRALAFSSRVTASGDLVVTFDEGAPGLTGRIVLEEELRRRERRGR